MAVEPTFANYTGSISFKSEFIDGESLEVQEDMENYFFGRLYGLKPDLQKQYLHQARTIVHGVLARISEMTRSGLSEGDIDREAKRSFTQFRSVEAQFLSSNASYCQMKAECSDAFDSMEARIERASLPFDDFVPPGAFDDFVPQGESVILDDFFPPDAMHGDLFHAQKKMNVEQNIALARMIGGAIEAVGEVMGYVVKGACEGNPLSQAVCEGFKGDVQRNLDTTGLAHLSEIVGNTFYREPTALSDELEAQYGIAPRVSRQFASDAMAGVLVGTSTLALGAVGKLAKFSRSATASEAKLVEHATVSKAANPVPRIVLKQQGMTSVASKAANLVPRIVLKQQGMTSIDKLAQYTSSFEKPAGFPVHTQEFYSQCKVHSFSGSKLGVLGNGTVNGKLLYQPVENGIFFFMRHSSPSAPGLYQKLGSTAPLLASENLHALERFEYAVKSAFKLAEEKGVENVYWAFAPHYYDLPSVLEKLSANVLGKDTFAQGVYSKPLMVLKVEVPKI